MVPPYESRCHRAPGRGREPHLPRLAGHNIGAGEVAAGRIEAVIDQIHPLSDIRQAETRLESREGFGKVILNP